jgi:hypothetical protein
MSTFVHYHLDKGIATGDLAVCCDDRTCLQQKQRTKNRGQKPPVFLCLLQQYQLALTSAPDFTSFQ